MNSSVWFFFTAEHRPGATRYTSQSAFAMTVVPLMTLPSRVTLTSPPMLTLSARPCPTTGPRLHSYDGAHIQPDRHRMRPPDGIDPIRKWRHLPNDRLDADDAPSLCPGDGSGCGLLPPPPPPRQQQIRLGGRPGGHPWEGRCQGPARKRNTTLVYNAPLAR